MSPPSLIQNLVENRTIFCQNLSVCVGVCVWGVCVFELGLFFHLSRSSLARATRQAAHTSNYANQAAARDGAFRRGGRGRGRGWRNRLPRSAESQKPHEKRIERRI